MTENETLLLDISREVSGLVEQVNALYDKIDDLLVKRVDALEKRVAELETFKHKVIGYLIGAGMLGAGVGKLLTGMI